MSQKIEGNLPAAIRGTGPLGGRTATAGAERARPVEAAAAGDSVRLTDEAASLQAVQRDLSAAPAIDPARVQAVRQALESGTYRIDAQAIAQRMLDLDGQLGG